MSRLQGNNRSLSAIRMRKIARLSPSFNILATNVNSEKRISYLQKKSSNGQDMQVWERLRLECDKDAYSVKWLDSVGANITNSIASLISSDDAKAANSEDLKNLASFNIKNIRLGNTRYDKIYSLYAKTFDELTNAEMQVLSYANSVGINANSIKELRVSLDSIRKKSSAEKPVSKTTGNAFKKFLGPTVKGLPLVGLGLDLTIMAKNIYESWINGKKILENLELSKYDIDTTDAMLPTPQNIEKISKNLIYLSDKFKNNPENLFEILEISKTLKAYSTDYVSAILNAIMVVLDLAEFTGLGAIASLALQIPLIGLEIANDSMVEEKYNISIDMIRNICDEKIKEYKEILPQDTDKRERVDTPSFDLRFGDDD